jgi:hypothetical protein
MPVQIISTIRIDRKKGNINSPLVIIYLNKSYKLNPYRYLDSISDYNVPRNDS